MEIFYAQKKLGKKNKHDADHTSALAAHTTFPHHFLPENAAGRIVGKCKPDSGKRGGCGHAFLHCRKGDKRRCTGGMYQSPVCDRPYKP